MWKRLKTKVLLKPPGSATRTNTTSTSLLHHLQSSCSSDTTDERSLNDYDPSEPDDPDLIRDSRKMSFPYLDKCSCGSPGLSVKDTGVGGTVRRTASLRRKSNNLTISEINRKNDGGTLRGKESCETAKNEYTKPESLFEERRKGSATSTPVMTAATTTAMTTTAMMTAATTTTAAISTAATTTTTTTSAGYSTPTGPGRDEDRVPRIAQQGVVVTGRKPGSVVAVQRSSTGLDDDDDSDESSDDEDPQTPSSSSESGSMALLQKQQQQQQKQKQRESGGSSDYTSLAFDVNYVRVSPPKMTRRQKPMVEMSSTAKKKPSRGSLLSGLRVTEAPPSATPAEVESEVRTVKQPQQALRDEGQAGSKVEGVVEGTLVLTDGKREGAVVVQTLKETLGGTSENRKPVSVEGVGVGGGMVSRSSTEVSRGKNTEYISLQDLQQQMRKPDEVVQEQAIDDTSIMKDARPSNITPKSFPNPSSSSIVDLVGPLVDDPAAGDSVTLFQDGDSSVLEFTFTVRLENDVIRRIRPEDDRTKPDSNSGSPVVSGSVNIVKTAATADNNSTLQGVLKPVITVGLRNVTVDSVATKSTDHDVGARKKHPDSAEMTISSSKQHLAERQPLLQQQQQQHTTTSRDCTDGSSSQSQVTSRSPLRSTDGGRARKGLDAVTLGRGTSDSRGSLADGVKTVTWAFDRSSTSSHAQQHPPIGHSSSHRVEETSPSLDAERRSPFARKYPQQQHPQQQQPQQQQQTLADFISSHQTKITTVAIVHKSADFDESTTTSGENNVDTICHRASSSDRKHVTGSGSSPATSSTHSNKSTPTAEGGGNHRGGGGVRGSAQVVKEPELTHMSWEEVMREAKALGIPLARPGSATRQQQHHHQQQQLQHLHHQTQRRSSVSSTTTDCALVNPVGDAKMTSSWACPTCNCPEAAMTSTMTSTMTSRRAARDAEKAKKGGSPFKEKFKLQNLFCRKQKDVDDGGKTTMTIKNKAQQQCHPHQHHQHQHHQQQQNLFHTMPQSCGGRVASSIEDGCCLRCVSSSKGGGGGGGGGGHPPGKTPMMSPSRLQSPLRMSFFSGTSSSAKKTQSNGGGSGDCTAAAATVHRLGCQWNHGHNSSPPGGGGGGTGKNNTSSSCSKGNGATMNSQRDNANSNSDSSTLSPRQKPGNNQDFLKSLEQLKNCGWYWGPLGFEEAEVRLSGRPDGAFLVRDSSDDRYILSLSFRSQGNTHHTRIEHFRGMFSFYAQQNIHEASTIVEFIENAMRHSQEGRCLYYLRPRSPSAAPAPVQLLYPVTRFLAVLSLKLLAQAALLSHLRRPDLIDRLSLSTAEKESLKRHQHSRRQRAGP